MTINIKYLFCLFIQSCILATASAEIYKCNDNKQQIIYTDRPCVGMHSKALSIQSLPTPLTINTQATRVSKNASSSTFTAQEILLLQKINKREQRKNNLEQWKEKQRYKLVLKQKAQRNKQRTTRHQKCNKHRKRLRKLENKARRGYKASESNSLYNSIRERKKSITTYCD